MPAAQAGIAGKKIARECGERTGIQWYALVPHLRQGLPKKYQCIANGVYLQRKDDVTMVLYQNFRILFTTVELGKTSRS